LTFSDADSTAPNHIIVVPEILPVLELFDLLPQQILNPGVPVQSAEPGVTIHCPHPRQSVVQTHNRDVEGPAAEIEHQ